jgi:hypothetical protein
MQLFNKTLILFLLATFSVITTSCNNPSSQEEKTSWPYQFVKTKTEQAAYRNVMDLFAFSGELDLENLKSFCRYQKKNNNAERFYYAVIFDEASNARFPTDPFTARFGLDEKAMKHIRAIYEYNNINGFSELSYYSKNSWESTANQIRIN